MNREILFRGKRDGDCKGFKVVGNIHDTPDLEKEEESE